MVRFRLVSQELIMIPDNLRPLVKHIKRCIDSRGGSFNASLHGDNFHRSFKVVYKLAEKSMLNVKKNILDVKQRLEELTPHADQALLYQAQEQVQNFLSNMPTTVVMHRLYLRPIFFTTEEVNVREGWNTCSLNLVPLLKVLDFKKDSYIGKNGLGFEHIVAYYKGTRVVISYLPRPLVMKKRLLVYRNGGYHWRSA